MWLLRQVIATMKKCPRNCNINKMGQAAAVAAMKDQGIIGRLRPGCHGT